MNLTPQCFVIFSGELLGVEYLYRQTGTALEAYRDVLSNIEDVDVDADADDEGNVDEGYEEFEDFTVPIPEVPPLGAAAFATVLPSSTARLVPGSSAPLPTVPPAPQSPAPSTTAVPPSTAALPLPQTPAPLLTVLPSATMCSSSTAPPVTVGQFAALLASPVERPGPSTDVRFIFQYKSNSLPFFNFTIS